MQKTMTLVEKQKDVRILLNNDVINDKWNHFNSVEEAERHLSIIDFPERAAYSIQVEIERKKVWKYFK